MNTYTPRIAEIDNLIQQGDVQATKGLLLGILEEKDLDDITVSHIIQRFERLNMHEQVLSWLRECDEEARSWQCDLALALLNVVTANVQEGCETLESLRESERLSGETCQAVACSLARKGHFQQAITYQTLSLQMLSLEDQPGMLNGRMLLGAYCWLAGQQEEARAVFREAYQQIQKGKAGFFEMPSLRHKTIYGKSFIDITSMADGDPAQARAELEKLGDSDSDSNILLDRAILSARLSDWDSAVEYIDMAFERKPKESGIETARAIIHYRNGDLQQALNLLQGSLYRVRNIPSNWARLGFIHLQLGSIERALSALYESYLIKKDPILLLCIAHLGQDFSKVVYDSISALIVGEIPDLALDIPHYVLPQESAEKPETKVERLEEEKPRTSMTLEELSQDVLEHPTHWKVLNFWLEVGRRRAWDKALPVAQNLIDKSPGYPQNHFLLADVLHNLGKKPEAEEQMRAALAVAPTEKDKQADVYFQAATRFYSTWGMVDQAVKMLQRSYDLEPNPDAALNLALNIRRQAEENSVGNAIRVLENAKKRFPQHEGILFHLARLYGDSQDYEKAEAIYSELLSFTSEPIKVYRDRGLVYKGDNPQEAIKAFELAIDLDDEGDSALYNLLIEAYLSNGEIDKALSLADCFISGKGATHGVGLDMYLRKASIYQRFGMIPEAIAVLRLIRQRGNKTQRHSALMSLGEIYLDEKRDLEKARQALEEAAGLGSDERPLQLLLQVYEGADDFGSAIRVLRKLRDRRPKDPSILDHLGRVLLNAGESGDAIIALTEALEFQPGDVSLSLSLIEAYVRNGQVASAESLLQGIDENGLSMAQRQRLAEIHQALANQCEEDSGDFYKYMCTSLVHRAASVRDSTQHCELLKSAKQYAVRLEEYAQGISHLADHERDEYKRLRYYVDALAESHLANQSEPWTDEHRKHLEQAKNSFYGAGKKAEGRKYEFLLSYAEAQSAVQSRDYDQADRSLQKALELRQGLDAPGIIHTQQSLAVEQEQLRALKEIAGRNFEAASTHYDACLRLLEAGSRGHQILQIGRLYTECLSISPEDAESFGSRANALEQALRKVREEGLGPNLAALLSLTYSYITLGSNPQFVQESRNRDFLSKQIVSRIVEIATGLQLRTEQKRRQESQVEIVRHPWLQRLPRHIYDRIEDQRYRLDWAKSDDEKAAALAKIYTYLDGCTAIVVEGSAKIIYGDNWEEEFYTLGPEFRKPSHTWPWGSRARALSFLNDLQDPRLPWMGMSSSFFKRLYEHIGVRNRQLGYAHPAEAAVEFSRLCDEAYLLFEEIVDCFPVFFRVVAEEVKRIEDQVRPFYEVEMLWYYPLKKCRLEMPGLENSLQVGKVYCLPPNVVVKEGQLLRPRADDVLENRSFEGIFLRELQTPQKQER